MANPVRFSIGRWRPRLLAFGSLPVLLAGAPGARLATWASTPGGRLPTWVSARSEPTAAVTTAATDANRDQYEPSGR